MEMASSTATRRSALLAPFAALSALGQQRRELRDRDGRLLGWVAPRSNGVLEARDRDGRLLGAYHPREDATRDRDGRLLYRGDALPALIVCRG